MSTAPLRQDARVIGLVGLAHGISHFYHVILAALFPWLIPAFKLSYVEVGLLMTVFFVVSGVGQALAGFVVDRFGARAVLFSGVGMLGVSALVLSGAQSYAVLMVGAMLAGAGNSVFHPADYTLLNQRVSPARLAHGFSVHGISGNIGWALSPLFMTAVTTLSDWRTALLCAAALPFGVLAILALNRHALRPNPVARVPAGQARDGSLDFLRLKSVWMCFAFFFITALALAGIQSFASSALVSLYGMSLALATSSYTAYMGASAAGMLVGGFLAAGRQDHDRTIALAFGLAALMAILLGMAAVPGWLAFVMMGAVGFAAGIAGPSRDLMIKAAAPPNATGRVFGVVYSGLDSGLAVGPLLFGALMDAGQPAWLFICIGVFQALAIVTAVGVGGNTRALRLQKA
ncbi:MFS transporter [Pseudoduganella namucuonensis]|uniref:Sugar phosphate permease n=1 Tax=Pseudoduganella namucuonensis TaxID=1035707 RepID=A0A1I7LFU0_9BURK|nr:MFS transporter [Pseudoduganella namucuonensis]SFV08541.1 Sugar phosphate permease [Pseudoduganella namucuonensis]